MNPLATALLAFSMSADAFAAAIARGASSGKLRTAQVAQIALTFGIVETLTPPYRLRRRHHRRPVYRSL